MAVDRARTFCIALDWLGSKWASAVRPQAAPSQPRTSLGTLQGGRKGGGRGVKMVVEMVVRMVVEIVPEAVAEKALQACRRGDLASSKLNHLIIKSP